ncbi:MAG: hypothetical protein HKN95_07295 [Acidimicrobiia bacterium]|nr:hypothetical protein [Acidimicrobiia bacterium]
MTDSRRPVPSKQTRPPISLPPPTVQPPDEQWIDLREAEQLTGIPASTVRNWARKHRIDSRFEMDESGDRRYVNLTEVIAWADHLGRQHKRVTNSGAAGTEPAETQDGPPGDEPTAPTAQMPPVDADLDEQPAAGGEVEDEQVPDAVDLQERTEQPSGTDAREDQPVAPSPDIPEGTMLVPLDAWNKMLNQLGNLHEAGQQLAEARERAAKAETEVVFLRERLTELRTRTEPEATKPAAVEPPAAQEGEIEPLWVDLYRRWKRRR